LRDFAASVLSRFRRKVRKGGRGLARQNDAARHQLRKDAKKLRYAAEFFASLFDDRRQKRRYGRFLETLEKLQDRLGLLNDTVSAPRLLARLGLDKDPEALSLLTTAQDKKSLVEAAADAHDAFADAKPFWR
jgi:CHAD domain-containing protein